MENEQLNPKPLETEKTVCHTYESLVDTLANDMQIDNEALAEEPKAGFDYKKIASWIGLVDYKDGVPNIEASLSSDRGKRIVNIDVRRQKTVGADDEKASYADQIYSMALTEAKMKVVAGVVDEVYPASSFQIEDYRNEMKKIREAILKDPREKFSLKDVLPQINMKRTEALISVTVLMALVLAACSPAKGTETTPGWGPQSTVTMETSSVPEYQAPAVVEHEKLKPRCSGWPGLEKNDQPYDGTVAGLANLAAECSAMGESSGPIKIFTFNEDTEFPLGIDTAKATMLEDEIITIPGLEFLPTHFTNPWVDLDGQEHQGGVFLTVPGEYGNASGFETVAPEGGWVLVTRDAAKGKLAEYELFKLPSRH